MTSLSLSLSLSPLVHRILPSCLCITGSFAPTRQHRGSRSNNGRARKPQYPQSVPEPFIRERASPYPRLENEVHGREPAREVFAEL